jgi:hypothetical protein
MLVSELQQNFYLKELYLLTFFFFHYYYYVSKLWLHNIRVMSVENSALLHYGHWETLWNHDFSDYTVYVKFGNKGKGCSANWSVGTSRCCLMLPSSGLFLTTTSDLYSCITHIQSIINSILLQQNPRFLGGELWIGTPNWGNS